MMLVVLVSMVVLGIGSLVVLNNNSVVVDTPAWFVDFNGFTVVSVNKHTNRFNGKTWYEVVQWNNAHTESFSDYEAALEYARELHDTLVFSK